MAAADPHSRWSLKARSHQIMDADHADASSLTVRHRCDGYRPGPILHPPKCFVRELVGVEHDRRIEVHDVDGRAIKRSGTVTLESLSQVMVRDQADHSSLFVHHARSAEAFLRDFVEHE